MSKHFSLKCTFVHLFSLSLIHIYNFEEPKATLTGKAIYDGEAVGVRSGSSEFALFQDCLLYTSLLNRPSIFISVITAAGAGCSFMVISGLKQHTPLIEPK